MNSARSRWRLGLWATGGAILLIAALLHVEWRSPDLAVAVAPLDSPDSADSADSADSPVATGDEFAPETDAPAGAAAAEEPAQMDVDALWSAIDAATVTELPAYKEAVQDRVLVRIGDVAGGWRAGQRIAIPIPQLNEVFTPVIERVQAGPNGSNDARSYIGTLTEVAGRVHRFTITVGPRNTFAHLSTPDGTYELVATGELGWLMPTATMDRHVDYSVPDFVVPEGPQPVER